MKMFRQTLIARLENNVQFKAIVTFNKSEEVKRQEQLVAAQKAKAEEAKALILKALQLMVESEGVNSNELSEDDITAVAHAVLNSDTLKGLGV